jgi:hypothetical protein
MAATWADEGEDYYWCARHPDVDAAEVQAIAEYHRVTGRQVVWPPNYLEDETHMITVAVRRAWQLVHLNYEKKEELERQRKQELRAVISKLIKERKTTTTIKPMLSTIHETETETEPEPKSETKPEPKSETEPEPVKTSKRVTEVLMFRKKIQLTGFEVLHGTLMNFVDHLLKIIEDFWNRGAEVCLIGHYLEPSNQVKRYCPRHAFWHDVPIQQLLRGVRVGVVFNPDMLPGGLTAIQLLNQWTPNNIKVPLFLNRQTGSMLIFAHNTDSKYWCSVEELLFYQGYRRI